LEQKNKILPWVQKEKCVVSFVAQANLSFVSVRAYQRNYLVQFLLDKLGSRLHELSKAELNEWFESNYSNFELELKLNFQKFQKSDEIDDKGIGNSEVLDLDSVLESKLKSDKGIVLESEMIENVKDIALKTIKEKSLSQKNFDDLLTPKLASEFNFSDADEKSPLSKIEWEPVWKNRPLFHEDIVLESRNIIQGIFNDNVFLSSVSAVISANPYLIKRLFITDKESKSGVFSMCFFVGGHASEKEGRWRAVVIDGRLPTEKGSSKLMCAHFKDSDAFWIGILEKCYASLFEDGYRSVQGFVVSQSIAQLTGGYPEKLRVGNENMEVHNGMLWIKLEEVLRENYLVLCCSKASNEVMNVKPCGIIPDHVYLLLRIIEFDGKRLLLLKNPRGEEVWSGDWGLNSELWNARSLKIAGIPKYEQGEFFIPFQHFSGLFNEIHICRVFPEENEKSQLGSWNSISLNGYWSIMEGTAEGCPAFLKEAIPNNPERNPHYILQVSRPATVFLTLKQSRSPTPFGIAVFIVNNGGRRCRSFSRKEVVSSSGSYCRHIEVSCEARLSPDTLYTVFVSTYAPNEEARFTLRAFCRHEFTLQPL
jgi:hypothetical protein